MTDSSSKSQDPEVWDLVIIGAGPAGLSCAIYAGRARISTLILEKMMAGGQTTLNDVIENFPGFPEGIPGFELAQKMVDHARRFGARMETAEVSGIDFAARPMRLQTNAGEYSARSLLLSMGTRPRRLGVPGEREFYTKGLSYCATCDGPLFAGKQLMVVGGGDAAIEEALFLAGLASKVTVVHRRDQLRAERILQERAFAHDKIEFLWRSVVTRVIGDSAVRAVQVRDVATGDEKDVPIDGVFVAVGTVPQTDFLPPEIQRDEGGFIVTGPDLQTSVEGVFAAGDLRVGSYRQITCAVGDGTLAYRGIFDYLDEHS